MLSLGVALVLTLVAVGCAPSCPPPAPGVARSPTSSPQEASSRNIAPRAAASSSIVASPSLLADVSRVLNAADHTCAPSTREKGVVVCDGQGAPGPSFVLTFQAPRLFFVSHFRRRAEIACADAAPVVNELNVQATATKIICTQDRVSFVSDLPLSTRGLLEEELAAEATRFQSLIRLALEERALRALLR